MVQGAEPFRPISPKRQSGSGSSLEGKQSDFSALQQLPIREKTDGSILENRGPGIHRIYSTPPMDYEKIKHLPALEFGNLSDLKAVLKVPEGLSLPRLIKVKGTLFPAGLLSSGWWQRHAPDEKSNLPNFHWLSDVQKWHFVGFNEWVPSWDWCWNAENLEKTAAAFSGQVSDGDQKKFPKEFVAQMGNGNGDEADSLPVCMDWDHAAYLAREGWEAWGGMTAVIECVLARRSNFEGFHEKGTIKDAGESLNFCLWIPSRINQKSTYNIEKLDDETQMYSGYLWKLLTPDCWYKSETKLGPLRVFFIWVHTDFSKPCAVEFSKKVLEAKEELLRVHIENEIEGLKVEKPVKLKLLAKSSSILEGQQVWDKEDLSNVISGRNVRKKEI